MYNEVHCSFFLKKKKKQENPGDLPKVKEKQGREKLNSYKFTHLFMPVLAVSHESNYNVIKHTEDGIFS